MTEYARHHRASREIIIVPVPYEIGSPKHGREVKPRNYPHQRREAWRPATRPPSKAERIARWLDGVRRQEEAVREMLKPDLALLKARWGMAA
jgi:hypothetical protein